MLDLSGVILEMVEEGIDGIGEVRFYIWFCELFDFWEWLGVECSYLI